MVIPMAVRAEDAPPATIGDPALLLVILVNERTRVAGDIPDRGCRHLIGIAQPAQPAPRQDAGDRRGWPPKQRPKPIWAVSPLGSGGQDLDLDRIAQAAWRPTWPGALPYWESPTSHVEASGLASAVATWPEEGTARPPRASPRRRTHREAFGERSLAFVGSPLCDGRHAGAPHPSDSGSATRGQFECIPTRVYSSAPRESGLFDTAPTIEALPVTLGLRALGKEAPMVVATDVAQVEVSTEDGTRDEHEPQDLTSKNQADEIFVEEVDTYNLMFIQTTGQS